MNENSWKHDVHRNGEKNIHVRFKTAWMNSWLNNYCCYRTFSIQWEHIRTSKFKNNFTYRLLDSIKQLCTVQLDDLQYFSWLSLSVEYSVPGSFYHKYLYSVAELVHFIKIRQGIFCRNDRYSRVSVHAIFCTSIIAKNMCRMTFFYFMRKC